MGFQIEKIYAWICVDDDGDHGIPAIQVGNVAMPLVGADKARIESYRPFAEAIASGGRPVWLAEFSSMRVIERLKSP
jgi:hypothetical protein